MTKIQQKQKDPTNWKNRANPPTEHRETPWNKNPDLMVSLSPFKFHIYTSNVFAY